MVFGTTHWSVVLQAGEEQSPQAARALEELCRTYWYPLYAYVRRRDYSPEDAQDLTQGFFARLLTTHSLAGVQPDRGRFRSFMLVALRRFLANQAERGRTAKRGGHQAHIPFDGREAEERYRLDAEEQSTPDKLFDRAWALSVMESASVRLQEEYRLEGKEKHFERLRQFLAADEVEEKMTYAAVGAELGLSEGAVKLRVHRLRGRYRELLREQVAQTVGSAADLEDEIQSLRAAFWG